MATTMDALAAQRALRCALDGSELSEPTQHDGLTVWPLLGGAARADYDLLDDAIEAGTARVAELDGGSVPELQFINEGERPVLLLDGEELLGAMQNRSLNLTILAPARRELTIPVSCMEAGRWHYEEDEHFRRGKHVMNARLRMSRMSQVSASLRASRGRARRSDQGAVWDEIGVLADALDAPSETDALNDSFERHEPSLAAQLKAHPAGRRQCGAIFKLADGPYGIELFDSRSTYRKLRPKLLRSWAIERAAQRSQHDAREFDPRILLDRICRRRVRTYQAIGLGTDARLTRRRSRLDGAALCRDGRLVHLAAFHPGG